MLIQRERINIVIDFYGATDIHKMDANIENIFNDMVAMGALYVSSQYMFQCELTVENAISLFLYHYAGIDSWGFEINDGHMHETYKPAVRIMYPHTGDKKPTSDLVKFWKIMKPVYESFLQFNKTAALGD